MPALPDSVPYATSRNASNVITSTRKGRYAKARRVA
jgi:hypothetical protein